MVKEKQVWINTRLKKTKRDAIDKLVDDKSYASRSEFFRTAIDNQLRRDYELDKAIEGK